MATNQYNESPADLETVPAGAVLYRILAANAGYAANSFNPHPRPLHDPDQGRFEPTDPALGGYLYVASTVAGAVAEGILRALSTCLRCNGNSALGGSGAVEVRGSGGFRRPGDVVPDGEAVGHLGR